MSKDKQIYSSNDETIHLRVFADGSKAEMQFQSETDLIDAEKINSLLQESGVVYGMENARKYCNENNIERKKGEYFPIALADDTSWKAEVEILLEPLECLLSPRLFSLIDLDRVRYINSGEKLAKIKTGSGNGIQNKNIFGRKIKDLAGDKGFLGTYLGEGVDFDTRRNLIIASSDGYALVENGKKLNVIDNILLQQDIVDGDYEVKTGLTLDGSLFSSCLKVGGRLKITGKVENCLGKGIQTSGDIELVSAENSLFICQGDMAFAEKLENCQIFADGYIKGSETSTISGGKIQSGRYIEAGTIGSVNGEETIAEITIAPYYKGLMIRICQELYKSKWNFREPDNSNPLVRELKELEMKYLKVLPDFLSLDREEKRIKCYIDVIPPANMRILHLSRSIYDEGDELLFQLVSSE